MLEEFKDVGRKLRFRVHARIEARAVRVTRANLSHPRSVPSGKSASNLPWAHRLVNKENVGSGVPRVATGNTNPRVIISIDQALCAGTYIWICAAYLFRTQSFSGPAGLRWYGPCKGSEISTLEEGMGRASKRPPTVFVEEGHQAGAARPASHPQDKRIGFRVPPRLEKPIKHPENTAEPV